jgi:dihydrofolate reductase
LNGKIKRMNIKNYQNNNHTRISLIAAVARNAAIGKGNALLWSEPEDQKHFRRVTMGCPVIMGRNTWDSLPERFRPLPGRRNMVLTRNSAWLAQGAQAVSSMENALSLLVGVAKVFVIGGAEIYALALPLADELILTEIDADLAGDTYFPQFDASVYIRSASETHSSLSGVGFRFVTYTKILTHAA